MNDLIDALLEISVTNCSAKTVEQGKADAYEKIVEVIEDWCNENVYCSFLVTIELDGDETTQILHFDGSEADFVWDMDWWEGEKNVKLLGFKPIRDISIHNCEIQIIGGQNEQRKTAVGRETLKHDGEVT